MSEKSTKTSTLVPLGVLLALPNLLLSTWLPKRSYNLENAEERRTAMTHATIRDLAVILFVVGVVLFIIGLIRNSKLKKSENEK